MEFTRVDAFSPHRAEHSACWHPLKLTCSRLPVPASPPSVRGTIRDSVLEWGRARAKRPSDPMLSFGFHAQQGPWAFHDGLSGGRGMLLGLIESLMAVLRWS